MNTFIFFNEQRDKIENICLSLLLQCKFYPTHDARELVHGTLYLGKAFHKIRRDINNLAECNRLILSFLLRGG